MSETFSPPGVEEQKSKLFDTNTLKHPVDKVLKSAHIRSMVKEFKDDEVILTLASLAVDLDKSGVLDRCQTIISDEASGRMVAYFIQHIINTRRHQTSQPEVAIHHIASGRNVKPETWQAIDDYAQNTFHPQENVLLVTELIQKGGINQFVQLLDKHQLNLDIATAYVAPEFLELCRTDPEYQHLESRLHYGTAALNIFNDWKILSGFKKDTTSTSPHPLPHGQVSERVEQARADIITIAAAVSQLLKNPTK